MEAFFFLWLFFAIGVAMLANSRGRSGFGFFLLSAFLSPLLGLIVVLVMRDEVKAKEEAYARAKADETRMQELKVMAATRTGPPAGATSTLGGAAVASVADELTKLVALRDKGVLSDEEFQAQKQALLRRTP